MACRDTAAWLHGAAPLVAASHRALLAYERKRHAEATRCLYRLLLEARF